jgi:hypothetical protein
MDEVDWLDDSLDALVYREKLDGEAVGVSGGRDDRELDVLVRVTGSLCIGAEGGVDMVEWVIKTCQVRWRWSK